MVVCSILDFWENTTWSEVDWWMWQSLISDPKLMVLYKSKWLCSVGYLKCRWWVKALRKLKAGNLWRIRFVIERWAAFENIGKSDWFSSWSRWTLMEAVYWERWAAFLVYEVLKSFLSEVGELCRKWYALECLQSIEVLNERSYQTLLISKNQICYWALGRVQ